MKRKEDDQSPSIESVDLVGSTKWLHLKTVHWEDSRGAKRKWDMASRATKHSMDEADAVVILPILHSKKHTNLETILVQQYRPPVGQCTLEFPAGLIDKGETAEQAAIRELQEETGFVGTVDQLYQSMLLCMSPGICDETIKIIVVNVDLDDPVNLNPQQNLDDGEDIMMSRVDLLSGLKIMMESGCGMPISLLYSFALGVELGQKYK
jgi:8-oxo-dGTP pyrophosphatase MutT (NUDIX family)